MSKERITYFDALKGFSIILVVFCHYVVLSKESIIGNIFMTLAWSAVPCFFMVTGGLMHSVKNFTWKKHVVRLLKVYITLVIWKLLYLCFYNTIYDINTNTIEIIKYLFLGGNINKVDTGPMWFMNAYLQSLIIYPITYQLNSGNKEGKQILYYMCFLLWGISILPSIINFFGISIMDTLWGLVPFSGYKSMLCYFILGSFFLDYKDNIKQYFVNKTMIPWILLILGLVGNLYIKYTYTGSFCWNGVYLDNGYNRFSTMIMAIGIYFIFCMDMFPKINKKLTILGKHTMGIFYLHYPILIIYRRICVAIIDNYEGYYSFGLNMLQTIIVLLLCMLITIVAKKIPLIKNIFS